VFANQLGFALADRLPLPSGRSVRFKKPMLRITETDVTVDGNQIAFGWQAGGGLGYMN